MSTLLEYWLVKQNITVYIRFSEFSSQVWLVLNTRTRNFMMGLHVFCSVSTWSVLLCHILNLLVTQGNMNIWSEIYLVFGGTGNCIIKSSLVEQFNWNLSHWIKIYQTYLLITESSARHSKAGIIRSRNIVNVLFSRRKNNIEVSHNIDWLWPIIKLDRRARPLLNFACKK